MMIHTNREQIKMWLDRYDIENYYIYDDLKVDVNKSVNIAQREMDYFPFQFYHVKGSFNCSGNNLTSLINCPVAVDSQFVCNDNQLTSLKYSPVKVGYDFIFSNNPLISIESSTEVVENNMIGHDVEINLLDKLPFYFKKVLISLKSKEKLADFEHLYSLGNFELALEHGDYMKYLFQKGLDTSLIDNKNNNTKIKL